MLKNAYRNILLCLVSPCQISLAWVPWVLCIGGWLVAVFVFRHTVEENMFVGEQRNSGIYTDWYAPILPATFRFLFQFQEYLGFGTSIQGLPYLSYITLLWCGLFLTLCPRSRFWYGMVTMPHWMVLVPLFALFAVWCNLIILSKSFGGTGTCHWNLAAYLMAIGLLLNMPKRWIPKMIVAGITLFFLYYGTAFRHNLVLALFPLLCWLVWHFCDPFRSVADSYPKILRKTNPVGLIVIVATVLWGGYIFLDHYMNYTVLNTYRMYVLQERFYADIFMLNYHTRQHYKNPPNTFGNSFDGLTEKLFRHNYDPSQLFVCLALNSIDDTILIPRLLTKEFVKVLPEQQFLELHTPYVFFDAETKTLSNTSPAHGFRLFALNEREVLEQYPNDYLVLRNAWIDRIKQDPFMYLKIKTFWWLRTMFLGRSSGGRVFTTVPDEFYPIRIFSGGLANGFTLFCVMTLLCLYTFSSRRLEPQIFPFLMLAWSALLTSLPLIIFLPDDSFRYLIPFFTMSLIAIAYFCSQSSLFHEIVLTIHRYLEKKAASIPNK